MKRTGPMNEELRGLIVAFEKHGKKSGKRVWKDLAQRLNAPSRIRAKVNVGKIDSMAGKMQGKIFVVPGKLLSVGTVSQKFEVACLDASEKAVEKVGHAKGKIVSLKELMAMNPKAEKMVIVE